MKKINLRDFYPFYTSDVMVEVPDEVALLLREYALLEEAYRVRTYRYKAFYSLEGHEGIEKEAVIRQPTPDEILEQRQTTEDLYKALAVLPEKQRSRICSHYLLGMSLSEIAKNENAAVSSVHEGIQRGLRRLRKILEEI